MSASSILNFERVFRSVRDTQGEIDQNKTLAAWKNRTIRYHDALMTVRAETEAKADDIRDTYSTKAAEPRINSLREDYQGVVKYVQSKVTDDLNEVMAAKRSALSKAMGAPSTDMVNTLTVLSLRQSLTDAELAHYAAQFSGNVTALAALGDIARKHGLNFPSISIDSVENDLLKAEDHARKMIGEIDVANSDMEYQQLLDWTVGGGGWSTIYFQSVDEGFTAALKEIPNYDKATVLHDMLPTGTEQKKPEQNGLYYRISGNDAYFDAYNKDANIVRIKLRGDEQAGHISAQFGVTLNSLETMNPDFNIYGGFKPGQEIIVPSVRMRMLDKPGAVTPDQCTPEVDPLD